jgi:hypothetical protein
MVPIRQFRFAPVITKVTVRAPEGQIIAHCSFMIYINICTDSAKAIHRKSRRYGVTLKLMCKSLQQNVTIDGTAEDVEISDLLKLESA